MISYSTRFQMMFSRAAAPRASPGHSGPRAGPATSASSRSAPNCRLAAVGRRRAEPESSPRPGPPWRSRHAGRSSPSRLGGAVPSRAPAQWESAGRPTRVWAMTPSRCFESLPASRARPARAAYSPLEEALSYYTEQGWIVHTFPWVVGITGMIDPTHVESLLKFIRFHWHTAKTREGCG